MSLWIFIIPACGRMQYYGYVCADGQRHLEQAVRVATQYAFAPCKLTISLFLFAQWHLFRLFKTSATSWSFDLLILKVVSESSVTRATSVPILVFLGLSVLDLGPMYATDRRQTKSSLNASALWGRRHNNAVFHSIPRINQTLHHIIHVLYFWLWTRCWIMPQILLLIGLKSGLFGGHKSGSLYG